MITDFYDRLLAKTFSRYNTHFLGEVTGKAFKEAIGPATLPVTSLICEVKRPHLKHHVTPKGSTVEVLITLGPHVCKHFLSSVDFVIVLVSGKGCGLLV